MSQHIYETEIEIGAHWQVFCTALIEYDYQPGEQMVRYYADGSGHPGSPTEIEPWDVRVTTVELGGRVLDRKGLMNIGGNGSWAQYLDRLALEYVQRACENDEPLRDDLIANAENADYE